MERSTVRPNQDDYDEKIVLYENGGEASDVSLVGINDGDYDFDFSAADTEATASASVTAAELDADASFESGTSTTGAGDIAEFNFTLSDTDETYVQIGSEDSSFVDVLYVSADDADEPIEIEMNTRLAGSSAGKDAVYNYDNVDTLESEVHSNNGISSDNLIRGVNLYENDGNQFTGADDADFESYLDAMDIIDEEAGQTKLDQLARPLQPTEYEIAVAGAAGETNVFDADSGGEANNQLGGKTLQLTQPEIGDITVHTAPEGDADGTTDVQELVDDATPREEVAVDDRLVVQVEATGLYGALVAGAGSDSTDATVLDPDWDRLDEGASTTVLNDVIDNTGEQITFEVTGEDDTGNQAPLEVDLANNANSETYLVLDNENGQFFLVADTSTDSAFANGAAPDEATTFTAELEYDADNADNRFELQNANNDGDR
ncbi:hypothetical protein [Halonotius sp. GCM10025705]|uniref:DUF7827 domain-containing protein n=1 Tax=Halonotius sp. GCM10025705 TaxID=3252678 RepID=UPI00360E8788